MKPFTYTVTVEVERDEGKFMSRDEIREAITEALESADPGTIEGGADGSSSYSVIVWEITE